MKNYTFVDYISQAYSSFVLLLVLLFHNGTVPAWESICVAHGIGILLVHLVIQACSHTPRNKTLSFLRHFYPALMYTWFFCETGLLNRMFFSHYLDPTIIRLEEAIFQCQPGIELMNRLPYLAVSELFYASYFSYYIMIAGVGIELYVRDRRQFLHYISVVSFVFYVCYLVYICLPVIGPGVFYGEISGYTLPAGYTQQAAETLYPGSIAHGVFFKLMAWIYVLDGAPGAAMPSSHVAIALTTLYFSFQYLRKIRYLHLVMAVLLCISTVYCRYHYASDVLAGALAALVLVPAGNWLYLRFGRTAAERTLILAPARAQLRCDRSGT